METDSGVTLCIKRTLQCVSVVLVFAIVFTILSKVIIPKFVYEAETRSPETEMWDAFYAEPKNTIDVIFIGNSHVYMGINPIVFYEETGLTSFDLSTSAQDIPCGYFLLREALKFQKPKYLVVDYGAFVSEMPDIYRTFANMKLSKNKIDTLSALSDVRDASINKIDYYLYGVFPFYYFHSRWDSIQKYDFDYSDMINSYNGYERNRDKNGENLHSHYYSDESRYMFSERSLAYFQKIKELCDDNGIEIIINSVPFDRARFGDFIAFSNYMMEAYGLAPYDFNASPTYEAIGLSPTEDYRDADHLNEFGAIKFTKYMSGIIFEGKTNSIEHSEEVKEYWNNKINNWNQDTKNRELKIVERMPEYLEAIKDSDYITLVCYNEDRESDGGYIFQDEVRDLLSSIGGIIEDSDTYTNSFSLILDGGQPIYNTNYRYNERLFENNVENGHCILAVDRQNYGETDERLNIVVYSKVCNKVIDSCHFELENTLNVLRN